MAIFRDNNDGPSGWYFAQPYNRDDLSLIDPWTTDSALQ